LVGVFKVLACGVRELAGRLLSRLPLYSGTGSSRLRRHPHRFATPAALLAALSTAGCAYQLDAGFSKPDADVEQTGSIGRLDRQTATVKGAVEPPEADLAYARAVAADVVGHGAKDASIPWENPNTGAGGNITPIAASYTDGAYTCRDFLASYVHGPAQAWMQGEACRTAHGKWEVRSLRPFKQS
jgi:surface antigen